MAVGEVGEICVRGVIVTDGYWKRDELTAETFRNGWLHTGDMATRDDDGYLYIVDRKKDMIISGGFNVYPREVEDVLCAHPGVAMAAVIGIPDERWGEAVKALVVPRPGAELDAGELIALGARAQGPGRTHPSRSRSSTRCRSPAWASPTGKPSAPATGRARPRQVH